MFRRFLVCLMLSFLFLLSGCSPKQKLSYGQHPCDSYALRMAAYSAAEGNQAMTRSFRQYVKAHQCPGWREDNMFEHYKKDYLKAKRGQHMD